MDIKRKINDLKYKRKLLNESFKETIRKYNREYIFYMIRNHEEDNLCKILEWNILFKINEASGRKDIDIPEDIKDKIDYSNVDFENVYVKGYDFTGMKHVHINPQKVFNKDLRDTILDGVNITGEFDDAYITRANFTNSKDALINPQKIYDRDLRGAILADTLLVNDLNNVQINHYTDFSNVTLITSKDAENTVNKIKNKVKC